MVLTHEEMSYQQENANTFEIGSVNYFSRKVRDVIMTVGSPRKNSRSVKKMKIQKLNATAAAFCLLSAFVSLSGMDFKLTDNGKPVCEIVVPKGAVPAHAFAASELSKYLGKISGGNAPKIVPAKTGKAYPVSFAETEDPAVKPDGFRLTAAENGLLIEYRTPVGALYGAYEILKTYGGIYWLLPAEDGEYYTKKPTISIPEQKTVQNPFRPLRAGNNLSMRNWGSLWLVRNNMNIAIGRTALQNSQQMQMFGGKVIEGYHCFSRLLTGTRNWKDIAVRSAELYKEHPEYFPLINGKRSMTVTPENTSHSQPCTSNPEVIRIMRSNLEKVIQEKVLPDGAYFLYNDDGTAWCQCENCRRQDSASDKADGTMTHRYWTIFSAITEGLWEKYPGVHIYATPYQNFQNPPENKALIPAGCSLEVAFNRTCWRHNIDDPNCRTNVHYCKLFREWAEFNKEMSSWEQLTDAGCNYMPIERTVINRLEFYKRINCEMFPELFCPIEETYTGYSKMTRNMWRAIWQSMYLMAAAQWDGNLDYAKVYEKINSLYYGEAWDGGMRELREYLVKVFSETPGCAGHGIGNPMGKMLEKPGVHARIIELFAKAEKAAAKDPDPRALQHVRMDREFFGLTWEKAYEDYVRNFREINAYRKAGDIRIDGVIDEPAWEKTDIISHFTKQENGERLPLNQQTYVRIVYEPDFIYFALEAMEPSPEKMVSNIKVHDGNVWEDNTLELFLNHPDMGETYYQLVFNAKGVCVDHFVDGDALDRKFEHRGEFKTRILKDRWVLEGRIPTYALGEKCIDGQIWKINIMRRRLLSDGTNISSSWSLGRGHAVAAFQTVNFAGGRENQNTSGSTEARFFVNGTLNEIEKTENNSNLKVWNVPGGIAPRRWMFAVGEGKTMEMLRNPADPTDYFIRTNGGMFFQRYTGVPEHVKISFHAKGRGFVKVFALQTLKKAGKSLPEYIFAKALEINSDKWEQFQYEYSSDKPDMEICPAFSVLKGFVDVDNVSVVPIAPGKKFVPQKSRPEDHVRNPRFDFAVETPDNRPGWKFPSGKRPEFWFFTDVRESKGACNGMLEHPGGRGDFYLRLAGVSCFADYTGITKEISYSFRAKGKGTISIFVNRALMENGKVVKGLPRKVLGEVVLASDEWKSFRFPYSSEDPNESLRPGFEVSEGTVCIDDVEIIPARQ